MKCRVCSKDIHKHTMEDMLTCVAIPDLTEAWPDALNLAVANNMIAAHGSDSGRTWILFSDADDIVTTLQGSREIYSHYLTKVVRKSARSESNLDVEADLAAEYDGQTEDRDTE